MKVYKWLPMIAIFAICILPISEAKAELTEFTNCGRIGVPPKVKMNTAVVDQFVKTIEVEKYHWVCGHEPEVVERHIQIFTELLEERVEREEDTVFANPKFTFEVVTCDIKRNGVIVGCTFKTFEDGIESPTDCSMPTPAENPYGTEITMNTAVIDSFVKTIKAEKDIFTCRFSPSRLLPKKSILKSLTTFTEIVEKPPGEDFKTQKQVFGVVCLTEFGSGEVIGCGKTFQASE